jgi:plasmid stability protein
LNACLIAQPTDPKEGGPEKQLDGKMESWEFIDVKTTLDIPDDLLRAMKMRAVQEGRKFKDVATEVFRRGLAQPKVAANSGGGQRVKLPLIQCRHPAASQAKLTPDQVADVLLKQELEWSHEATRR